LLIDVAKNFPSDTLTRLKLVMGIPKAVGNGFNSVLDLLVHLKDRGELSADDVHVLTEVINICELGALHSKVKQYEDAFPHVTIKKASPPPNPPVVQRSAHEELASVLASVAKIAGVVLSGQLGRPIRKATAEDISSEAVDHIFTALQISGVDPHKITKIGIYGFNSRGGETAWTIGFLSGPKEKYHGKWESGTVHGFVRLDTVCSLFLQRLRNTWRVEKRTPGRGDLGSGDWNVDFVPCG